MDEQSIEEKTIKVVAVVVIVGSYGFENHDLTTSSSLADFSVFDTREQFDLCFLTILTG